MARQLHVLAAAALLLSGSLASGEPPMSPQGAEAGKGKGERRKPDGDAKMSPEFDNVRKAIEALTPEQRQRFQENFSRWSDLPPERKNELRNRDEMRRKRVREEVENAIREGGLELSPEQRELFTKRYAEERRKIEEQVRREMWEKRKPLIKEVVERLKAEFSKAAAEGATATPSAPVPAAQP